MKRNFISKLILMAIFATASMHSRASIVWDWSPEAVGTVLEDTQLNMAPLQYFAEKVSFQHSTHINGMDIYSYFGWAQLGMPVKVSIWNDNAGQPGSLAAQFTTALSAVDTDGSVFINRRSHADFAGFNMNAGDTYWIGMAGDSVLLGQTVLKNVPGGDGKMAYFRNNSFYELQDFGGDMAFRLYGEPVEGNTVPEPGTLLLFTLGAVALSTRRRST